MQVVYMENDFLRIGVLVGRGADIFEFYYKPAALDFMCRLDRDIRNPREEFPQIRDTANQLEDYYYGGWQEALPNSLSHNYCWIALKKSHSRYGAVRLGFHCTWKEQSA